MGSSFIGQSLGSRGVILILFASLLGGCSFAYRPQYTTIDFNPQAMEIIGPARGEVSKVYLLGIPIGDLFSFPQNSDSAIEAVAVARRSVQADALINVVGEQEIRNIFFWFYWKRIVRVEGIGVKWKR